MGVRLILTYITTHHLCLQHSRSVAWPHILKSDNLQCNTQGLWVNWTIVSLSKFLIFQVLFLFHNIYSRKNNQNDWIDFWYRHLNLKTKFWWFFLLNLQKSPKVLNPRINFFFLPTIYKLVVCATVWSKSEVMLPINEKLNTAQLASAIAQFWGHARTIAQLSQILLENWGHKCQVGN